MSLTKAIQWQWPGARCVVRGGVLERWDGPMAEPSPAEVAQALTDYTAAASAIDLAALVQATSRQKDVLAMLAVIVRQKNVSAWNALTTPQKVAAVLAEADLFKTFREFIDDKV